MVGERPGQWPWGMVWGGGGERDREGVLESEEGVRSRVVGGLKKFLNQSRGWRGLVGRDCGGCGSGN